MDLIVQADRYLRACEQLPLRSIEAVGLRSGVVVVAPHPDDESLCGLIRLAARRGSLVHVIVVSDGTVRIRARVGSGRIDCVECGNQRLAWR